MSESKSSVHARNIILTAAAFWVAGAMAARAFEAPAATAQPQLMGEHIPMQKARIQGNLHGLIGLKFEEYILNSLKSQIKTTLANYQTLSIEAKQVTKDQAVARLHEFLNSWRFNQAPVRSWTNNLTPAETVTWGLGNTNVNDVVRPEVILRLKDRLQVALDEAYGPYPIDQPLTAIISETIARIATTGTSAGFGEWVCIFNPESGQTEWFNEQTGEWAGAS